MQELYRAYHWRSRPLRSLTGTPSVPRLILYFLVNIVWTPWMNQVALSMVVLASFARLEARTVSGLAEQLHVRWRTLFPAYQLMTVADWIPLITAARHERSAAQRYPCDPKHLFSVLLIHLSARQWLPALPASCATRTLPAVATPVRPAGLAAPVCPKRRSADGPGRAP